jgi:hypothetical protein
MLTSHLRTPITRTRRELALAILRLFLGGLDTVIDPNTLARLRNELRSKDLMPRHVYHGVSLGGRFLKLDRV